jgi:hypothetical protein
MKHLAAAVVALVMALATLPLVLAGGDSSPLPVVSCGIGDGSIETILATIRTLESGGNYTARAKGSTASGAYQFLDSTWNGYGGYSSAWMAPPAVQDSNAAQHVESVLAAHHGDVAAMPVVWYVGYVPADGSPDWDVVPYPTAGNVLTPRQYRARWMATYRHLIGRAECSPSTSTL